MRSKRKLDEYRPIEIQAGIAGKAEGSALVKIGNSQVLVGVKMGIGQPFPDSPDEGVLMCSAELLPMASPTFEPGPPDENAIELARVVDRGIRESGCVDLKKLVIKEGEKVWMVFVDIYALDYDGNLMDAAALGAIAALSTAKIPKYDETKERVDYTQTTGQLPMNHLPIACSFAKVGNEMRLDPNLHEEKEMSARITITTKEDGSVCAVQKAGPGFLTEDEVNYAIDTAVKKGAELRSWASPQKA